MPGGMSKVHTTPSTDGCICGFPYIKPSVCKFNFHPIDNLLVYRKKGLLEIGSVDYVVKYNATDFVDKHISYFVATQ